jgi:chemotaxis family two-component system sensor kinase Cph1
MQAAEQRFPVNHNEAATAESLQHLRDELELVGKVTSHDLLAPLRAIASGCEELEAQTINTPAHDTAKALGREAERMKIMMQGLLDYVRLETFTTSHAPVSGNDVVSTALGMLEGEIKQSGAIVTYDNLPRVEGHRGRLVRMMTHVVENALKFHGGRPPVIHIGAHQEGGMQLFCIEDNGIGIDQEDIGAIFRLFQRLHTVEGYPGYGIGLTLAQKIAEAHGGKLWAESTLGLGSRFYITLPAAANN